MMMHSKLKKLFRGLTLAFLTLGLGACGSIIDTGQDMVPDTIFDLEPLTGSGLGDGGTSILLEKMSFPTYIDTFKITVKPGGQEIQYLADAKWADTAPRLISRHLEVSLENQGFTVYSGQQSALPHSYRLFLDVRDFSAHLGAGGIPSAVVEFEAKLVDAKTLDLISSRTFSRNKRANENSRAAIARAFQEGLDEVAVEISGWVAAPGS